MAAHVFNQSKVLVALLAVAGTVIVALAIGLAANGAGGGSVAAPQSAPAAAQPSGITVHQSRSKSTITVEGKTATGESVTVVGEPGKSVKGKAGKNGKTGSAKGGAGGSASAKGGSATAGSVVIQTTTP